MHLYGNNTRLKFRESYFYISFLFISDKLCHKKHKIVDLNTTLVFIKVYFEKYIARKAP